MGARVGGLLLVVGACGESSALPPPTAENLVDTAVVYAITGTAIGTPSAFDLVLALPRRPELQEDYDFVFDVDTAGRPVLLPARLTGLGGTAGFLRTSDAFDDIDRAPIEDYVTDSVLVLEEDMTFLARSRSTQTGCSYFYGAIPRYGKIEVIALDLVARTVTLKHLVNLNCGYRSLTPGLPDS